VGFSLAELKMDEKIKILIEAIKEIDKTGALDMNKEKKERKLRVDLFKKSVNELTTILEEEDEDKVNINEKMDDITKQMNELRIKPTADLGNILPGVYEESLGKIKEVEEK